jgi:Ca2+-binding RTX toxin-like protein
MPRATRPFAPPAFGPLERRTFFAATLDLDTAWGGDGLVVEPADVSPVDTPIDIAAAPDGSAVVIASGSGLTGRQIIRYNADGSIDKSFASDGRFLLTFDATAVAIAPDGRVIAAGSNTVMRLNPDGGVDDNFGFNGFATITSGGAVSLESADISIRPDGDVLLLRTGLIAAVDPLEEDSPAAILTRLDDDGDVEDDFGTAGSKVIDLPVNTITLAEVQAVALTGDERILVGGAGVTFGQINVSRLDQNGDVDGSFRITQSFSGGVALGAIDADSIGNVTLLTSSSVALDAATVTRFDPAGVEQSRFTFSRLTNDRTGLALATAEPEGVFVGFEPYQIARLATDQIAEGVFLDDDGTLQIVGTGSNDSILVNRANSTTLRITRNGVRTFVTRADVTQISLTGGEGSDSLTVTVDIPTIASGEAGNDTIQTAGGADQLFGGDGNDVLIAGAGKDLLLGGVGADRLAGESGKDRLAGEGGRDKLFGGSGDDQLDGGASDDFLFGEAGADKLFGFRGNDILDGGSGIDLLFGGADTDAAIAPGPDSLDAIEKILNSIDEI